MSKNILVISTSPRKGGNSETLADALKSAFTTRPSDSVRVALPV